METHTMVDYNNLLKRHSVKGSFGLMGQLGGVSYFYTDYNGDTKIGSLIDGISLVNHLKEKEYREAFKGKH